MSSRVIRDIKESREEMARSEMELETWERFYDPARSVHSESNDETSRAKDIFKEEGAHDISSTGEAHSDVKAEDVSNTADTRVREVTPRSGLSESGIPSPHDSTLRETERDL
jgi:hypothetical protein